MVHLFVYAMYVIRYIFCAHNLPNLNFRHYDGIKLNIGTFFLVSPSEFVALQEIGDGDSAQFSVGTIQNKFDENISLELKTSSADFLTFYFFESFLLWVAWCRPFLFRFYRDKNRSQPSKESLPFNKKKLSNALTECKSM